ncbi:MAG TPA: FtsX-like permease family protein, partial [Cellvibrionaceae bacterium]
ENALLVVGAMVLISSLLGIVIMLLSTLRERQRELALLRIVGAGPGFIFLLIEMEIFVIAAAGALVALLGLWLVSPLIHYLLALHFSVVIHINLLTTMTVYILTGAVTVALLLGVIPAWRAYRASIHTGVSG